MYPRTCQECANTYKSVFTFQNHQKKGTCQRTKDKKANEYRPPILIDEVTGEEYVEFRIFKGRGDDAVLIGRGKLSKEHSELAKKNMAVHQGYASFSDNGHKTLLHRKVMNVVPNDGFVVDHINNDRLDCRISNLRIASYSLNCHNRKRKKRTRGTYVGTLKLGNHWYAKVANKSVARCKTEIEAAACYNVAISEKFGADATLNDIELKYESIPAEFRLVDKIVRRRGSGNIYVTRYGRYEAKIMIDKKNIRLGAFKTEEEAEQAITDYQEANRKEVIIRRNILGIAILDCKGQDVLVDDDTYLKFHTKALNVDRNDYVMTGGKYLHRLVMNAQKGQIVDHRNHNLLDVRRESLKIVTSAENAQNRKKKIGASSLYFGVNKRRGGTTWTASVRVSPTQKISQQFRNEVDAAKWYDEHVVLYYGKDARKNFY